MKLVTRRPRLPQGRALLRPGLTLAQDAAILSCHAHAQVRCEAEMKRHRVALDRTMFELEQSEEACLQALRPSPRAVSMPTA